MNKREEREEFHFFSYYLKTYRIVQTLKKKRKKKMATPKTHNLLPENDR